MGAERSTGAWIGIAIGALASVVAAAFVWSIQPATRREPRSERARFFAAYDALRIEGPLDARGERLRELAALPLTSHDLVEARDTCLRAHSYLLDLESAHELSATMLDEGLVPDSALLAWSERGLPRVEPMFRDCAELVGRLR